MNKRCQDANAIFCTQDPLGEEILALVVSDGAGSAEKSDEGSALVCREFVNIVGRHFAGGGTIAQITRDVFGSWVCDIHEAIRKKACSAESVSRDFACTFLALIVAPTSAIAAQIGDGALVVGCDEAYETAMWPQSGQYVNTTNFVTDDNFISNLHVTVIDKPIDEVAAFSDGVQMLALHYATKTVFEPFLTPMLDVLRNEPPGERHVLNESLAEYLDSPAIRERTDDDKTLVLATRYRD